MSADFYASIERELALAHQNKTFKYETPLSGPTGGHARVLGRDMVMLAANNYLGLANHPKLVEASIEATKRYGYGLASVRFLCGTQDLHLELERRLARFLGVEDAILFSSCWAANEGVFNALLANDFGAPAGSYKDAIYSDRLNHASIIDGIRLCRQIVKGCDLRAYRHLDLAHLEELLAADDGAGYRFRIVVTDGVFSMEGDIVPLDRLYAIARRHGALVMVDDSHATGPVGPTGRGTPELFGLHGQIDILTGTLGKALGGAAGGYIAGKKSLVDFLRQKGRPYTFSNSLPPAIVGATIAAIDLIEQDPGIVESSRRNTAFFRHGIEAAGFTTLEGSHPIVPVMLGEAAVAQDFAKALLEENVYVKGLWYPVVPQGEARLRCQISAAHTQPELEHAIRAFTKVGRSLGVLPR
jgi:glycine C-acetyltransferase